VGEIPSLLSGFTPGAAGIWTLVVMFAAFLTKQWVETRKLSIADRQARRDGYAKQVENLQRENRNLRKEMAADREHHEDYRRLCQLETDQMRGQIVELQDEVTGLKRQIAANSVAASRSLGFENVSTDVAAAAERTSAHLKLDRP
jgi:hypothetical protein